MCPGGRRPKPTYLFGPSAAAPRRTATPYPGSVRSRRHASGARPERTNTHTHTHRTHPRTRREAPSTDTHPPHRHQVPGTSFTAKHRRRTCAVRSIASSFPTASRPRSSGEVRTGRRARGRGWRSSSTRVAMSLRSDSVKCSFSSGGGGPENCRRTLTDCRTTDADCRSFDVDMLVTQPAAERGGIYTTTRRRDNVRPAWRFRPQTSGFPSSTHAALIPTPVCRNCARQQIRASSGELRVQGGAQHTATTYGRADRQVRRVPKFAVGYILKPRELIYPTSSYCPLLYPSDAQKEGGLEAQSEAAR